jgi:Na+/phosphate symporter
MKTLVRGLTYSVIITAIGLFLIMFIDTEGHRLLGIILAGLGSFFISVITIAMGVNIGISSTKEDS